MSFSLRSTLNLRSTNATWRIQVTHLDRSTTRFAESNQISILSNFDHGGRPITHCVASDTRAAISITHPLHKNKQFTAQATATVDKSPRQHPSITRQSKADDCGQACTRRTTDTSTQPATFGPNMFFI